MVIGDCNLVKIKRLLKLLVPDCIKYKIVKLLDNNVKPNDIVNQLNNQNNFSSKIYHSN